MNNGAAVMVRDLRKSYRHVAAVRGIDLEISRGEVFALLGPNGAGKTTTVEILEGFRRRDHGTVGVLREDGTTIVLTTHYLDEAEALADRIAVIASGLIVAEGAPDTLGGRASAAARVSWEPPGGARRTVETSTPTATITELARQFSGEIPGLVVTRPTLEEVYLDLIAAAGPELTDPGAADPGAADPAAAETEELS